MKKQIYTTVFRQIIKYTMLVLYVLNSAALSQAQTAQTLSGPVGINSFTIAPKTELDIISPALPQTPDNFEIILKGRVSDAANDYFNIQNGSTSDGNFIPIIIGYRESSLNGGGLLLMASGKSTLDVAANQYAMMRFTARLNDQNSSAVAQTAVANTPLFAWDNFNTVYMQMLANGNLGIGTTVPTTQLHTTGGVRFQGLVPQAFNNIIVADAKGNLATQPYNPSTTLSCNTANFLSKVTGTNALGCSQVFDNGTNVGIGTTAPTAQFHTTGSVRFQGLTTNNAFNNIVVADGSGNLAIRAYAPGAALACGTVNYVPKVTGANALSCSQIFDNGTSVGIGTNTGFTYTSGATLSLSPILPGATITLKVNGLTSSTGYVTTSDGRFKQDVKTIEKAMDKITALNGVSYNWKTTDFKALGYNFDTNKQLGFIAQDLMKVLPEAVIVDGNGYYAVNYTMLIPLLTEAIKEQQKTIEEQGNKIEKMDSVISTIRSIGNTGTASTYNSKIESLGQTAAVLYQNVPNPFNQSTTITYFLPNNSGSSSVMIFDLSGKLLKTITIDQKGQSNITINGSEFQPGMYIYSLVIDGQEINSKRMILTQ